MLPKLRWGSCKRNATSLKESSLGSTDQSTTIGTRRSPLDLYLRPGRFFEQGARGLDGRALVVAAWLVGMNWTLGRLERMMLRADLGDPNETLMALSRSWLNFWVVIAVAGVISAAFVWLIGTWWYRVRLRWSGASDPSPDAARVVYVYSGLVWAVPSLLWTLAQTFRFPNFAAAWASESVWDLVLLVFPFWACWVSYRGVRATFDVRPARALFWFLVLPIVGFLFAFGVVAAMYSQLG